MSTQINRLLGALFGNKNVGCVQGTLDCQNCEFTVSDFILTIAAWFCRELGDVYAKKLQKLQNRAIRIITRASYDANACALLARLKLLDNLYIRRKKLKTKLMFKVAKGNMPSYLQTLFSFRNT